MKEYNGVTGNHGSFKVQLGRKGKVFYLGNFPTAVQAAQAYDRAILLSQPWTDRKHALNFDDTKKPSDNLTKFEEQMLTHLRTYHPSEETNAKNRALVDFETPDVLLDDYQNVLSRKNAVDDLLREVFAASEKTIRNMALNIADLKQTKQFYMNKLAEAEAEISRLRGVKNDDGTPKWTMKRVVPKTKTTEDLAREAAEEIAREAESKRRMEARNAPVIPLGPTIKPAVPETPASPAAPIFVEPPPAVTEPCLQQNPIEVPGVADNKFTVQETEFASTAEDDAPIYPEVPAKPNSLDEISEQSGFSKE